MALDINEHMMTATFDDLLAALSARTGLPLVNNDGVCAFCIDDRPFSIQFDEERARVVVTALVKDVKNELALKNAFADDQLKELVGERLNTFPQPA